MKNTSCAIIRGFICFLLVLGVCFTSLVFFQDAALAANTGNIKYLNTHPDYYGWYDAGFGSVPLPLVFEPSYVYGSPPFIQIYNPSNRVEKGRTYDATTWNNSNNVPSTYPFPPGYIPLGIASSYKLVINPSTGNILSLSTNGWLDFGWSSIPIPAGFRPLGYIPYPTNYACIINTTTGAVRGRDGSSTSWTEGAGQINLPPGYEPLGYYHSKWYIIDSNRIPTVYLTSPTGSPTYTEQEGSNVLTISGTVTDLDTGDALVVKYTIDGLASYTNVILTNLTANGSAQNFSTDLPINSTIPEGTYTLRVWAEDNNRESSSQSTVTIVVDKSSIGDPYLRVISSAIHNYAMNTDTGSYTDVTDVSLQDAFGNEKPFYVRSYTYKCSGSSNTFYDTGYTATCIDDNILRVVTSEGKAFDIFTDTWTYTDVTATFLIDNFGSGKPFYHRAYEQELNNSGPFTFHDFSSTMAYIGNNILRVVTAEGKAFDVDKDTGNYTEITGTFMVNNFGSGKPFYLRTSIHTIGGTASTFYDWGTAMAYIGNDTLRVVTSEGKAFNVDVNTGAYTDITSTFLISNFGNNKPFYQRAYPITFSGVNYTLYDFGCTMSYSEAAATTLTITSPHYLTSFDEITLTGQVSDEDGDNVTVSATLGGISKSTVIANTSTPQDWSLTWDIAVDQVPDGYYTNITVSKDDGNGETCSATYTGSLYVYGPSSNVTKKIVHYEYDENGKLLNRRILTNP